MHPYRVGLWAIYSDTHCEVDIAGDQDGIRGLADWIGRETVGELVLDRVPASWLGVDTHALEAIGLLPSDDPSERVGFERKGTLLVISGHTKELSRIVAGPIGRLAELPYKTNSVGTHLHLDPTSDPERHYYAPSSGSLTISLSEDQ